MVDELQRLICLWRGQPDKQLAAVVKAHFGLGPRCVSIRFMCASYANYLVLCCFLEVRCGDGLLVLY